MGEGGKSMIVDQIMLIPGGAPSKKPRGTGKRMRAATVYQRSPPSPRLRDFNQNSSKR
jgi:hypothetical protein